jgi:hypothetical protein
MGFSAKLEADLTNWSGNISKAGKDFDTFATKTQKDINSINNAFKEVNSNSIGGLQNRLTLLKQNLENATDIKSIAKYNIRIKGTQDEIERLKNLGLQAGNATKNIIPPSTVSGLNGLSKSFGNANGVALEFNRIIQDAPFGMIGMGNNIQQLVGNWQVYVVAARKAAAETGATVTTMQLLRGAMGAVLNPVNLLSLGVSVATSAWTFYTMWSQKANKSNKDLDESTSKLTVTLRDFKNIQIAGIMDRANKVREEAIKQLRSYDIAQQDAIVNSRNEVAELNRIYTASQDTSKSIAERTKLVKYLKAEYPDYLKKFSVEEILAGKASIAYDKLTTSIQNMAKAKVFGDIIAENTKKEYENSQALLKIRTRINAIEGDISKNVQAGLKGGNSFSGAIRRIAEGNLNELRQQAKDLEAQNNLLSKDSLRLETDINKTLGTRTDILQGVTKFDEEAAKNQEDLAKKMAGLNEELKKFIQQGRDQSSLVTQLENIDIKYNDIYKVIKEIGSVDPFKIALVGGFKLQEQLESVVKTLKPQTVSPFMEFTIPDIKPVELNFKKFAKNLDDMKAKIEQTRNSISEILGSGFTSIIANSMSSLGEALATGGNILGAIGNSLVSTLGSLAKSIGEQLIAFGTAGIALKFMITNPFLAIAAGAALVALGSFATASVSKTVDTGTKGGYFGYQSQDYSTYRGSLYDGNRTQTINLELKNGNLIGAIDWSNKRNNRLS